MARVRGGARNAPRHTGDAYGQGYQYEYPQSITPIILGPWSAVWPLGDRDVPGNTLQSLKNGILVDGVIYPLWGLTTSTAATREIQGVFSLFVINKHYRVVFYKDNAAAGVLKVEFHDGNATTTVNTGLTTAAGERIAATVWQGYVYFGYKGATQLHRILVSSGTYSAVASSPNAVEFLFVLDNNMVAISQSGDTFLVEWSVDSDPLDWASSGAGSYVLDSALGRPQGVGSYKGDAIIVCLSGGVQMSATGQASPAFRFAQRREITGCPWTHAVVGTGDEIYYFTSHRRLFLYNGQEQEAGNGEKTFENIPNLFFSARLNLLFVCDPVANDTIMLDVYRKQWASNYNVGWDWLADSPADTELGHILAYINGASDVTVYDFDLDPASYDAPEFQTGRFYLGNEIWIDHIDVVRTNETAPKPPALVLRRELQNGKIEDKSFAAESGSGVNENGTHVRYHVSGPAQALELQLSKTISGRMPGPFLLDSLTAGGNIPTDYTNPATGYRAQQNAAGNFEIAADKTTLYGASVNANGNLVLATAADIWTKNVGIERIIIYGKELQRGRATAS